MSERTLRDVKEAGLLAALQPVLQRHTANLPLGTGDDVAITNDRLVWTIDSMVEGTHFRWYEDDECTARSLATKLVASNISDLASKGARPLHALLSLGLPADTPMGRIEEFYAGLDEALTLYEARLIGGDTVQAPQWCLTLVAVGALDAEDAIAARSAAEPGMNVFVTGWPGESAAGYQLLNNGEVVPPEVRAHLLRRHLAPTAQVAAGRALVSAFKKIAMIDVSDGIAKDAGEIARMSKLAIVLEREALPLSENLRAVQRNPLELFLHGGEDYELLFCTAATLEEVRSALAPTGVIVHRIGGTEAGEGVWLSDGNRSRLEPRGFEHFSP